MEIKNSKMILHKVSHVPLMRIVKDLGIGQWDTIVVSPTENVVNPLFTVIVLRLICSIQDLERIK